MELKWLGHASWEIKVGNKVIYIDPYEGEPKDKADLILSSHSHSDHCNPDKVKPVLKDGTIIVAPKDCEEKLNAKVRSLKPGESEAFGDILVEAVEAYNYKRFRSPGEPFHPKGFGVGYLIKAEGKTVYHTGDTDFIKEMKQLEGVDLMLTVTGGTYTMDNPEAAEAVISIGPSVAIPQHIWDTTPGEFKKKVEAESDTKVVILKPGDTYIL
jgi:L-ascorbate metabolism protein UlaG (beta-lactamase superfamily)